MTKYMTSLAASVAMMAAAIGVAHADIKIGATLAETGPAGALGDPEAKTLRLLVKEINDKGGVNGQKIELIVYDDNGDPNKARTFATRLVEKDQVVAIIGGTTTGATMAVIPVVEEAKIPFISLAGAIEIIDPVKKWVFKTPHTDRMACAKIFDDIKKRGLRKIALISSTDGFGSSMRNQCLATVGEYGLDIVADEKYGPQDVDMTPQLTNIKGKEGLQAIINPGFGQGAAVVTRNVAQLAIKAPLYESHGVASKSYIDLAGVEATEGVRLPGTALLVGDLLPDNDPQKKVVMAYKKLYEEETKTPASTFGGYAHDAMRILVDAIKRAGSTKPEAIRDAIEKTAGLVGTTGTVTMTAKDHLGFDLSAFKMLEVRKGAWTIAK